MAPSLTELGDRWIRQLATWQRWGVLALLCGFAYSSTAHRLDELLQASRIDVGRKQILVELDLTPGVETLGEVLPRIDLDQDGIISTLEAEAYGDLIRAGLKLDVDHHPQQLTLTDQQFPTVEQLKQGVGMIRLKLLATITPLKSGRHEVRFSNPHQSEASVYLANALVPSDPWVQVRKQTRDQLQREITIEVVVRKPRG